MHRYGRSLTLLSSAGAERVVEEARAWNPISVDVAPVRLKEIFLETTQEDCDALVQSVACDAYAIPDRPGTDHVLGGGGRSLLDQDC
jgi:hypothetical protein